MYISELAIWQEFPYKIVEIVGPHDSVVWQIMPHVKLFFKTLDELKT